MASGAELNSDGDNIKIDQSLQDRDELNRALQVSKTDSEYKQEAVSIVDIDTAILSYLEDINLTVESNGQLQQVPIIYGAMERWNTAKRNGYIRDQKGQVQLPLIMFKRNNLSRRNNIVRKLNREERITYTTGRSEKNKFDKFSQQIGLKPTNEIYKVRVGDHVQMDYDFIIWTEFVSHTNQLIEQLNWNNDEFWGVDDSKKFQSTIDSFSTSVDVANGEDRVVRTTFTLNVNGYLLPDSIKDSARDEQVVKGYTTQKVITITETETGISTINSLEELDNHLQNNK